MHAAVDHKRTRPITVIDDKLISSPIPKTAGRSIVFSRLSRRAAVKQPAEKIMLL